MAKTSEVDEPYAFGRWIETFRGLTPVRQVAARTGKYTHDGKPLSDTRWRQIEVGYEPKGDFKIPVNPKAETVVIMCLAVEAPVEEGLRLAGFNLADHPGLQTLVKGAQALAEAEARGPVNVRRLIENDPLLDGRGRKTVLAVYDSEVAREAEVRRQIG